ncbi:hypothetical protein HU200_000261 [Digitaria exilis]|uniref:ATP synthase F0 subunit 8 n=1 Tax=Digitaria exilis TaxID=1010633 RepID=A0A835FZ75_9POAL|nr:hypothetical protein HU200_000261 [Digitaria exilis]
MVPSSWNNFLWPLLHFVVVRSNHGERLVRINKEEEERCKKKEEEERCKTKEEDCARSNLQGCWSPFFGRLFSACLLSVCLCGLLFDFLHRFEIEFLSCLEREYCESVVCNLMMYSALI